MQFSQFLCLKSQVWLLNHLLNGVSEAPRYLLHLFLVLLETFTSLETFTEYLVLDIYCPKDIHL